MSPTCSVVGQLGHGDSLLERTMRRYKGRRPWNYLTLLVVLAVLAIAVFPTVFGAKKEPDYYEVCTSVRREAVYSKLLPVRTHIISHLPAVYHASIIPTAVVRKLVCSPLSPFRNALHVAIVTTLPTIPAKPGLQVLPAESQVLPVKVPFRQFQVLYLLLCATSICDCTAHVQRVHERRGGSSPMPTAWSAVCCLLVPFTFVTTHTGPDPRLFTALPAACLPPQVLGVSRDCSERDVTRAYRKQVPPPPLSSQSVSKQTVGGCSVVACVRTTYNLLHVAGQ